MNVRARVRAGECACVRAGAFQTAGVGPSRAADGRATGSAGLPGECILAAGPTRTMIWPCSTPATSLCVLCVSECVCVCVSVLRACLCACLCACVCMCACVCLCVCVCVCVECVCVSARVCARVCACVWCACLSTRHGRRVRELRTGRLRGVCAICRTCGRPQAWARVNPEP